MTLVRKPAVAGSFYPNDAHELKQLILSYLENAVVDKIEGNILGIISPHAGYIYSGQCAAYSYKAISHKNFKTAIIIAPSHQFGGFRFSIGNFEKYLTPLGELNVNKEISEMLLSLPEFDFIIEAHKYEHSLEVQLPFLQVIFPDISIVPIIFGNQNLENAVLLGQILSQLLTSESETIVIVSSDLSHYHSSDIAISKDLLLAEILKERNEIKLWEKYLNREIEACGIGGILALIKLSKILGFNKVSNLKYMHSGEINYDYSQVVGYLSSIFYSNNF